MIKKTRQKHTYIATSLIVVLIMACRLTLSTEEPDVETPAAETLPRDPAPVIESSLTPDVAGVQSSPTPEISVDLSNIQILGYNYQLIDAGDGWSDGTVDIAFENVSEDLIAGGKFALPGAIVETQEDKTYPVKLVGYDFGNKNMDHEAQEFNFSNIPRVIPPHFRWTRGYTQYSLLFRAATIAHPLRIVFPTQPEWTIDLAASSKPLAFPADTSVLSSIEKPISDLAGFVLMDEPGKVLMTLDGTARQGGQQLLIQYTLVNRDQFEGYSASYVHPFVAHFYPDGQIHYNDSREVLLNAGPGQTVQDSISLGYLFLLNCIPGIYGLLEEGDDRYSIYNLDVCGGG